MNEVSTSFNREPQECSTEYNSNDDLTRICFYSSYKSITHGTTDYKGRYSYSYQLYKKSRIGYLKVTNEDLFNSIKSSLLQKVNEQIARDFYEMKSFPSSSDCFDGIELPYYSFNRLGIEFDEDALEFTELDIDYLDVDFLTDALSVVEELVRTTASLSNKLDNSSLGVELKGAALGFNQDSQFNIYESDGKLYFYRSVNETIQIVLGVDSNASITTSVDGYIGTIILNGGEDTIINLRQGG